MQKEENERRRNFWKKRKRKTTRLAKKHAIVDLLAGKKE